MTWESVRRGRVLFEDAAALVLNKPPGIAVTGERHETDLVRLAADQGETLYPAHRIDKVTSGAILFARQLPYHGDLTRQFNRRTVDKAYLAVTRTSGLPDWGVIDLPLSVGRKNRVRIAAERANILTDGHHWTVPPDSVFTHVPTYPSTTAFATVWSDDTHSLLVVRPITGRRHQIRVHLAWIGHALAGDPLFGRPETNHRTLLHAWRLAFNATWLSDQRITITAPPDNDFWPPTRDQLVPETVLHQADERLTALRDQTANVHPPDDNSPSEE